VNVLDHAARSTEDATTPRQRGRIDKRRAILEAAFAVFAREGYAHACVEEIADQAGVAKPTVYNHLNDKATLFRRAIAEAADQEMAENLAVIDQLRDDDTDLSMLLTEVGGDLVRRYHGDRSWALRRLLYAEIARFPDLPETVLGPGANRLHQVLADRFARLALAGRLRRGCVLEAAEQFLALLTGPVDTRSRLGTRPLADAELRSITEAAVRTFVQAYGMPEPKQ
jgi:TetR/AcrR family transcriptional regulator, mexJK operon transcriptional repressor